MLVIDVINVDTSLFFWLSQTRPVILRIQKSGCTVLSDSKETKLRSSQQEAFPSAGRNIGVVLMPCPAWKCVHTAISNGVDIFEVPGSQKLVSGLMPHKLTVYLSDSDLFLTQ